MARYFKAFVTGRPLEAGGRSFIFEPVSPMGGGWQGVLAVDDNAAASILAAADGVTELTEEQFEAIKKKRGARRVMSPVSGHSARLQPELQRLAGSAKAVEAPSPPTAGPEPTAAASSEEPIAASVALKTTAVEPPPEPLLEHTVKRRKGGRKKGDM